MAIGSDMVRAEVVDAEEFGGLSREFNVGPVPVTFINSRSSFLGAQPEDAVLREIFAGIL